MYHLIYGYGLVVFFFRTYMLIAYYITALQSICSKKELEEAELVRSNPSSFSQQFLIHSCICIAADQS